MLRLSACLYLAALSLGMAEAFVARTPVTASASAAKNPKPKAPFTVSHTYDTFSSFIQQQQKAIIKVLETEEADSGAKFRVDQWGRGESEGATCVLEGGAFLEKAAVSVSLVKGTLSAERAASMSARGRDVQTGAPYAAAALSLVLHSANPHLPTFRADVRYFECQGQRGWFGGGADLTPYYLHEEDVTAFHKFYKGLCDRYDHSLYPALKAQCDNYFYLPGRLEHRGTGGIFFDDLEGISHHESDEQERTHAEAKALSFTMEVAKSFMAAYTPLVAKRRHEQFTEKQREWMLIRRGRYLEFNLLYDRGVKFGLAGGRFESVMVSAPPLVAWKYDHQPEPGSPEAELVEVLKRPREWV